MVEPLEKETTAQYRKLIYPIIFIWKSPMYQIAVNSSDENEMLGVVIWIYRKPW